MTYNQIGIIISIFLPFLVLGCVSFLHKRGLNDEICRKIAHILLSHWILLAISVYTNVLTICILPLLFVVVNYLSAKKIIPSSIERANDKSLGTVWYAVSLFILCLVSYILHTKWVAACGMLVMGYGDGFGALIGKYFGKHKFNGLHSKKSLEGSFTVAVFSFLVIFIVCRFYETEMPVHYTLLLSASCAVPIAFVELFTPRGLDNLTLPLIASTLVYVSILYPIIAFYYSVVSFALIILTIAYYLNALTYSGIISATVLGILILYFGGTISFFALLTFFILGSLVSYIGKQKKADAALLHERTGARSCVQVIANGFPALLFAAVYFITSKDMFLVSVICCLSTANADTFSSEIGMLSKTKPVSILTLKPIQKGLSGGITLLGLLGALLGALLLSAVLIPHYGFKGFVLCSFIGFLGALIDSVFGASLQAKYQNKNENNEATLTERMNINGKALKLTHGVRWINNDVVNFISTTISGLLLLVVCSF